MKRETFYFLIGVLGCCAANGALPASKVATSLDFEVTSDTGKVYNLNLRKAGETLLHPNLKVIHVKEHSAGGKLIHDVWEPSKDELRAAQEVFIDENNIAAVRFHHLNGERHVSGVVDGHRLEGKNGLLSLTKIPQPPHRSDYVNLNRNLTKGVEKMQPGRGPVDAVIELLVVCDKEFGDMFNQDRRRMLDYLTTYYWDVSSRFKTLPSSNISFRINGVVIIESFSGQPFIEEARAEDGRAEFGRILGRFASWTYEQGDNLPKFDLSIVMTNTDVEWGGGLAYMSSVCWVSGRYNLGAIIFNNNGDFGLSIIAAHEIGHALGAPHDDDDNGWCDYKGYIMSGATWDLMWYFSPCSDRTINDFLWTHWAFCTRRYDMRDTPAVDYQFDLVRPPSMDEQCRRRLQDQNAVAGEDQAAGCKEMKCWRQADDGVWWAYSMVAMEDSPCGHQHRCFRGKCRPAGTIITSVQTGLCMRAKNPFNHYDGLEMIGCKGVGTRTPLDMFSVLEGEDGAKILSTPYNTPDATEKDDKCMYSEHGWSQPWTHRCDGTKSWQSWDFNEVRGGEYMIVYRNTGQCLMENGFNVAVRSSDDCDAENASMRWRLSRDD